MQEALEVDLGRIFVSTATNCVDQAHGPVVQVRGNTAVLSVTVESAASLGTFDLDVQVEGSYDGVVWSTSDIDDLSCGFTVAEPANQASNGIPIIYPYLRVRTTVSQGTVLLGISLSFIEE
ncbi:MAG: hypothetical protein H6807_15230 [Planctomycetes bacterium]|nr:hypothetical protein [Planctomycetota bacterium]